MSLFIEKARQEGKNSGGLYVLGILVSFIGGQIIGALPLIAVLLKKGAFSAEVIANPELAGIDSNIFMILMLLPFVVSFVLLWVCIRFVHKKRFIVSWTAFEHIQWKKIAFSFFLWLFLSFSVDAISYMIHPENYEFHYSGSHFWILVLISVLLLPLQTTYEELLFRSYIMQAVGLWKPMRMIPFLITGISFGFMHILNPEVKEYGYATLITYIGIGLLLSLVTMLSDSIELAVGLHAANNIYGATMVSFKGSALSTDCLFYTKEISVDATSVSIFFLVMIIYYLIVSKQFRLLPLKSLLD